MLRVKKAGGSFSLSFLISFSNSFFLQVEGGGRGEEGEDGARDAPPLIVHPLT